MYTVLLFVAILAILILVHEFGHFFVAKRAGARVEEFGIGFPPRIFGFKKGDTIYSLNIFPIGGFVKIYGEDGLPAGQAGLPIAAGEKKNDPASFASKTIGTRALIVGAGVFMNLLLAVFLLSFGHAFGLPQALDDTANTARVKNITVYVADVAKGSPAEGAGIQIGDAITALAAPDFTKKNIQNISEVQEFVELYRGKEITIFLKRENAVIETHIVPRKDPPKGEGALGIAMAKIGEISYPFYLAPFRGIESTAVFAWGTIRGFGAIVADFLSTGKVNEGLAGPIGIARMSEQAQKMGFLFLLQFVAFISINLAIINAVPFPALDGGRLLFLAIEKIKGSPVKQKYEKLSHTIGFALLIILMILITFRDIGRFLL